MDIRALEWELIKGFARQYGKLRERPFGLALIRNRKIEEVMSPEGLTVDGP